MKKVSARDHDDLADTPFLSYRSPSCAAFLFDIHPNG